MLKMGQIRQGRDGLADIDGVAVQPVPLGDNENISRLHLVQELGEPRTLRYGGGAGDRLGDHPVRFDVETGRRDLPQRVAGILLWGGDTGVGKGSGQDGSTIQKGCPKFYPCSEASEAGFWTWIQSLSENGRF